MISLSGSSSRVVASLKKGVSSHEGFAPVRNRVLALGMGVAAWLGVVGYVGAQAPDAVPVKPPTTLWNFLGIPQGTQKVKDSLVNTRGNHPNWERTPALKQIADPANQQSPNPAIKAAAKAKADADLAPQKIKAIKYLATVCCGCSKNKDDVKEALLAAMDDCTEEVRYEAAMALCQCSGDMCAACNAGTCCDAKVMNKLLKVSEGKDEQGCWLEASARVRAVAANGLNACRQVRGPQTPTEPPKRGGEAPGELPTDGKAPSKTGNQTPEESAASVDAEGRARVRPVGYLGIGEGGVAGQTAAGVAAPGVAVTDDPTSQLAGLFGRERRTRTIWPLPAGLLRADGGGPSHGPGHAGPGDTGREAAGRQAARGGGSRSAGPGSPEPDGLGPRHRDGRRAQHDRRPVLQRRNRHYCRYPEHSARSTFPSAAAPVVQGRRRQ